MPLLHAARSHSPETNAVRPSLALCAVCFRYPRLGETHHTALAAHPELSAREKCRWLITVRISTFHQQLARGNAFMRWALVLWGFLVPSPTISSFLKTAASFLPAAFLFPSRVRGIFAWSHATRGLANCNRATVDTTAALQVLGILITSGLPVIRPGSNNARGRRLEAQTIICRSESLPAERAVHEPTSILA